MKVDLNKVVYTLEGKAFNRKDGEELTLRMVCVDALSTPSQENKLSFEDRIKRDKLATKIYEVKEGEVEITTEEATAIKSAVNDGGYMPRICGALNTAIEG